MSNPCLEERECQTTLEVDGLPELYDAAYYFGRRLHTRYVVAFGIGNADKLRWLGEFFQLIVIDSADRLRRFRSDSGASAPGASTPIKRPLLGPLIDNRPAPVNESVPILVEWNLEHGLPVVPRSILSDAVVLCSDALPFLKQPTSLRQLALLSRECPVLMLANHCESSTALTAATSVRAPEISRFEDVLRSQGVAPFLLGLTIESSASPRKNARLAISGTLAAPPVPARLLRVLAVIHVFNENDILGAAVAHLLQQSVDVRIVDNWSSDGSYESACALAEQEPRVQVERFPADGPSEYFDLKAITANVERIARQTDHDWIIHHDTDEIRESPWPELTLEQAISAVDAAGFNAIDFSVLQFKLTDDGFAAGADPTQFFTHCEFARFSGHFLQVKAWKNAGPVNLSGSLGHHANSPGQRIFPIKFLLKHYPLRSLRQANEKLFKNRAPRIPPDERGKRFIQYDLSPDASYLCDKLSSEVFNPATFSCERLLERISGVGILRDAGYATGTAS
jgi:Glycosyl transferase family 2